MTPDSRAANGSEHPRRHVGGTDKVPVTFNLDTDSDTNLRVVEQASRSGERGVFLALAVILFVSAVVRLIGVGRQSFSIDEIHELRIAHASIAEVVTFGDGFPPLYNLLFHFLLPLGGLAGRVLSAALGVATVAVAWGWARRIGGPRMSLCAASLVALAPLAVQLSGEGRAYGLMALLAAASLWSLWVALDNTSTMRWVRWGLISALGVYAHYLFAVLVAAWVIVALIEVQGRPRRAMWMGIGTFAVLAAPVLALLSSDRAVQMGPGAEIGLADMMYAGYRLVAGFFLGPSARDLHAVGLLDAAKASWIWVAVLTPVVALLLVQGFRTLSCLARRRLLALSVSGALLESAAIKVIGVGFGVRYFLWLVVPLAVWLAGGLAALRTRWRWASAMVLLVVAVYSMVARYVDPHHQTEDARAVATYLESSGDLDHAVLVLDPTMTRPIVYYINRPVALALPDYWDPETGRLGYYPDEQLGLISIPASETGEFSLAGTLRLADVQTEPGELYSLVYSRPYLYDPQGELLATLSARDGLTLVKSFAGIDLYRGVRAG